MIGGITLLTVGTVLLSCCAVSPYATGEEAAIAAFGFAKTVCDGAGGFVWEWLQKPEFHEECFILHEQDHIDWFHTHLPGACEQRVRGANPSVDRDLRLMTECHAFRSSLQCLIQRKAHDETTLAAAFLNRNIWYHERAIAEYCGGR